MKEEPPRMKGKMRRFCNTGKTLRERMGKTGKPEPAGIGKKEGNLIDNPPHSSVFLGKWPK